MKKVDERRERVYQYIFNRIQGGVSPTIREICNDLGIPSNSTALMDLRHLADIGLIEMDRNHCRTIRIKSQPQVSFIPLLNICCR